MYLEILLFFTQIIKRPIQPRLRKWVYLIYFKLVLDLNMSMQ